MDVIKGRHMDNALTQKKASRAFLAAFATATPPARLRAGWRAALRKCDERSRAVRRICVICVSFFHPAHLPLTHLATLRNLAFPFSSCPLTTTSPCDSAKSRVSFFILPTYHYLTLRLCEISRFLFSSCPLTTNSPCDSAKSRVFLFHHAHSPLTPQQLPEKKRSGEIY